MEFGEYDRHEYGEEDHNAGELEITKAFGQLETRKENDCWLRVEVGGPYAQYY